MSEPNPDDRASAASGTALTKVCVRGGIALASLLISLTVLEFGLRWAGTTIESSRARDVSRQSGVYEAEAGYVLHTSNEQGATERTILAIGDSFTFGGNVEAVEAYPSGLSRILRKEGYGHTVANLGRCEDNTFGVTVRLERFLAQASSKGLKPEAVVILVGASDRFNQNGMHEDPQEAEDWLRSLRVFKMGRAIQLAIKIRALGHPDRDPWRFAPPFDLVKGLAIYQHLRDAAKLAAAGDDGGALRQRRMAREVGKQTPLPQPLEIALEDLEDGEALFEVRDYLLAEYAMQLRNDAAIELVIDIASNLPEVWNDPKDAEDLANILVANFELQSAYSAPEMGAMLDRAAAKNPALGDVEDFMRVRQIMKDWARSESQVAARRSELWSQIAAVCKRYGVAVVVQTYPSRFASANDTLRRVAQEFGYPLVDNHQRFTQLTAEQERRVYLTDDNHCTPRGYEVIAQDVFDVLIKEGILSKDPT